MSEFTLVGTTKMLGKYTMKYIWLLILICHTASANDLQFKIGPTMNTETKFANKLFAMGYSHKLTNLFDYQIEGGLFNSLTGGQTYFGAVSLGTGVIGSWYYSKIFCGPAYVSKTNEYLNTPIEITSDIEFGLRDNRGVSIGLDYKHFSNGGLVAGPNLGRDFLVLKLQLSLGQF